MRRVHVNPTGSDSDSEKSDANFSSSEIITRAVLIYDDFMEKITFVNSIKEELSFYSTELSENDLRTLRDNSVFAQLKSEVLPRIESIVTEISNDAETDNRNEVLTACQSAHRALSNLLVDKEKPAVESRELLLDKVKSVSETLRSVKSGYHKLFDVGADYSSES